MVETGKLIQILVFVLAAVIVGVFVISGFHFVRSVYLAQLELERDRSARNFAAHVAQRVAEPRVIELKERDGVIITQPDGAEDIALTVELEETGSGAAAAGPAAPSTTPADQQAESSTHAQQQAGLRYTGLAVNVQPQPPPSSRRPEPPPRRSAQRRGGGAEPARQGGGPRRGEVPGGPPQDPERQSARSERRFVSTLRTFVERCASPTI